MANQQLIQGELFAATGGIKDGGFLDIAGTVGAELKEVNNYMTSARDNRQRVIKEEQAKAKAVDKQIAGYVNKMKSNVDLTGVPPAQQKAIQSFLIDQKDQYVQAANEIVKYSASDPEYMYYADIMNSVNNSFVNAANTLKTYKASQTEFIDDFQNGRLSDGDLALKKQAGEIYSPDAKFTVENGDFVFTDSSGNKLNYRDFKNPANKAYKTATSIANIANTVYKSGAKLSQTQAATIRLQLEEAFNTDPNALRSIAADGFFTGQPMAISQEQLNDAANIDELQDIVINQILTGISASADQGYNEKMAKQRKGNGNNPTKQYKTPETKYLTSKEAPNGKAGNYAVYLPYNPGDPIKYVAIGGGSGEPTTTTTPTLPDNNVNNEKMKLAEDFIKSKYKNLKPGSKEFTDKLMEKYNSL